MLNYPGEYLSQIPGDILTSTGQVIGEYTGNTECKCANTNIQGTHQGIYSWTIGQRVTICFGNEKYVLYYIN